MLLVVGVIGMLVHYYSIGYMHGDEGYYRFFAYLNLFMFAMFVLILADSYLLMFLGWEGVGLCSYLLISFWFRKKSASQAGKKAFLVNRVGDFGFTLGMLLIFVTTGTLQFAGVFEKAEEIPGRHGDVDLPAALHRRRRQERAVPAARLAAGRHGGPDPGQRPDPRGYAMVNAGVYMVARSYPLFITQRLRHARRDDRGDVHGDLRRLHRDHPERHQEGDRVLDDLVARLHVPGARRRGVGGRHLPPVRARLLQGPAVPVLGSVIHAMSGEQDMRQMGGLRKSMPVTFWTMLIGAVALIGVFPFAGFWAKDEILGGAFVRRLLRGLGRRPRRPPSSRPSSRSASCS